MALTPEQHEAAIALAGGLSMPETAELMGVARSTVWRWAKDPEFSAVVDEWRESVVAAAKKRLHGALDVAVNTLIEVAKKADCDSARVSAAKEILARGGVSARVEVTVTEEEAIAWLSTLPEPEALEPDPTH